MGCALRVAMGCRFKFGLLAKIIDMAEQFQ